MDDERVARGCGFGPGAVVALLGALRIGRDGRKGYHVHIEITKERRGKRGEGIDHIYSRFAFAGWQDCEVMAREANLWRVKYICGKRHLLILFLI